jgi:geranylgeranylglycerol-phosphate geranylgeranyltransferase
MKKLKAVWELMRLEHGVMIFIAIFIGSIIALKVFGYEGFPPADKLILTFFTALFLEASTFALNDYYDIEIDKKNKRNDRPLVRGDLNPKTALLLFFIFFPLGILCSFFVNYTCFVIALITALFAILYDVKLKKIKLLGNFYIAYVMAIPFIFGGAAVLKESNFSLDVPYVIFLIALIAFLTGSGREIMKDVMDFSGDKEEGVKSFPLYIGIRKSNILAACFYIVAVFLSLIPFFVAGYEMYYYNYHFLFLVLITDVLLLFTSFHLIFRENINMKIHRKTTLIAIFVGLIAFLIGVYIG